MKYHDVTDPDTVFECDTCGALVVNQSRHDYWHARIAAFVKGEDFELIGEWFQILGRWIKREGE